MPAAGVPSERHARRKKIFINFYQIAATKEPALRSQPHLSPFWAPEISYGLVDMDIPSVIDCLPLTVPDPELIIFSLPCGSENLLGVTCVMHGIDQ